MPETITIDIEPKATMWVVHHGEVYLGTFRSPYVKAARELLARGHAPDAVLVMRHRGTGTVGLTGPLRAAAAWDLKPAGSPALD
jgi:hypothetical protein